MKLLFLTQWFNPEPVLKGIGFIKELEKLGYDVEILTGFPNYPEGKIYEGYKIKFFQKEVINGVKVIRTPLFPSHDTSSIKRVFNYLSFALSATFIGVFLVRKADVMYVYHPPATIGIPALFISKIRRIPYVYDIQDLWPDTLKSTDMVKSNLAISLVDWFCKLIYKNATSIIVLSKGFKSKLINRKVPIEKINIIYNWSNENSIPDAKKTVTSEYETVFKDKFNIVFAGNMGKAQALEAVLDAAKILSKKKKDIQIVLIGAGIEKEKLQKDCLRKSINNVRFLNRVSKEEIKKVYEFAEGLLVHLKNSPLFEITIPSKTQAYLLAGRPIIMGVKGDAADLVEKAGAGIRCTPESPDSIAEAILKLYKMPKNEREKMGDNGKSYYQNNLSFDKGVKNIHRVIQNCFDKR